jgi:magnesium transporter
MAVLDLSSPLHELVFETAAEHVSTRVAVVSPAATVKEVRRSLAGQRFDTVVLAFFLPGIVYLADAVGTQTETLVIRGLSVGVPLGRVVCRELLTGLFIRAALGLGFFPFAFFRWGNYDVALAVGLALVAACSTASLTAMTLPWFLQRLGADPAFGSGPLATVVQDLLSLVIYLVICRAALG